MAYALEFRPQAFQQLGRLRKYDQVRIVNECALQLQHQPTKTSKSRIKKLENYPGYRLRVDEFRVFYTVDESRQEVVIHGVAPKEHTNDWLAQYGPTMKEVEDNEAGNGSGV